MRSICQCCCFWSGVCPLPRQQRLIIHHNGGKRHAYHGTRRPKFEERTWRPSGIQGAADEGCQLSPRNGSPEDGVYDSWNMIEAGFLASFGFCSMKYLMRKEASTCASWN